MPKVFISDKLSPRAATIFEEHGIDVDVKPGLSPDELKAIIADSCWWVGRVLAAAFAGKRS